MERFVCVAASAALAGCSSSTSIRVSDPDARIYVNGEYVGTGRAYYSDRRPAFSKQKVTVRKDGCAEQHYVLRRNEKPDLGAIVGAYYLAVPRTSTSTSSNARARRGARRRAKATCGTATATERPASAPAPARLRSSGARAPDTRRTPRRTSAACCAPRRE